MIEQEKQEKRARRAEIHPAGKTLPAAEIEGGLSPARGTASTCCAGTPSCAENCSESMQNYLAANLCSLRGVGYTGGNEQILTIPSVENIAYTSALSEAALTTTTQSTLTAAALTSDTVPVIAKVTPSSVALVSSIGLETKMAAFYSFRDNLCIILRKIKRSRRE